MIQDLDGLGRTSIAPVLKLGFTVPAGRGRTLPST
jgi:hypothetical protein